ncbi:pyrroloquinoline quinone precursor peptide PqqA [uncultured Piscinibacter sp.]|uniref:pyrroloquinoline quinone precursor peptide PqqA n=1 Tax=uncultured Piscinibacter sp. TaxID=1131835 RepID=UPI00345B6EEC
MTPGEAGAGFKKFMRLDSWCGDCANGGPGASIQCGMNPSPRCPSGAVPPSGDCSMQWQTPTAADFRFGFEITMYVAAR